MVDETAYNIFLTSAPTGQGEKRTIEIFHPQFSSVLRFVKDFTDRNLTLEAGAPRNAGETVTFTALALVIEEPSESQEGDQVLKVSMGAVANQVEDQISQISGTGFLDPIEVVYRKYYSEDLSEPVKVLYLDASFLSFEGYESVDFTAEDADFYNKSSGELYTLERFPTLTGV